MSRPRTAPVDDDPESITPLDVERLGLVAGGYAFFQALVAAARVRLFDALSAEPLTLQKLARAIGVPESSLRVILHALGTCGLVRRDSVGRYRPSALARVALVSSAPNNILAALELHAIWYEGMADTTASLKRARNVGLRRYPGRGPTIYARQSQVPKLELLFHKVMGQFTHAWTQQLASLPRLNEVRHLLDVGGGDGSIAIKLCEAMPELRATVYDFPTVVRRAKSAIRKAALQERMATLSGNMFKDALPRGFDGISVNRVMEIFSRERDLDLAGRVFDALDPGGAIFLSGFCADEVSYTPSASALHLFFLSIASGEGSAYPPNAFADILTDAGFVDVVFHPAMRPGQYMMSAVKPRAKRRRGAGGKRS